MNNSDNQMKLAIDWLAGIECKADQLRDVLNKAEQAGFKASHVQVIGGKYRVEFKRSQPTTPQPCN